MISNELLIEVLRLHCGIKSIKNSGVIYWFDCIGEIRDSSINIYELAYKCKEWALNIGYSLESITNRSCIMGNNYEYYASVKIHKATNSMIEHNIDEDTETKAIFKACQWILDNKDNK